jgi:hypothetical protein
MATYCFAEPEGRRALFVEVGMRGMLAAVYDFPRFKTASDCDALARQAAVTLRQEVCCTEGDNEAAYQQLVAWAWVHFYQDIMQVSEREMTVWLADIKRVSPEEAQVFVRDVLAQGKGQAEIDNLYAQYVEATQNL